MRRARRHGTGLFLLVAVTVGVATPVAVADVTGMSPSSATVEPGQGATATVRIRSEAVSCLTVRSSSSTVAAEVDPNCGAGDWTSTLYVGTSVDTPPGTYTIRVIDSEGGETKGANFTLRVQEPEPAPTSTAAPTTTTTTSTTTAAAPTTTETAPPPPPPTEPPSTEPPPVTEAPRPEVPADAFVSVEGLIAAGIPETGFFFPLEDPVFRGCLPLTSPCEGRVNGLVLIPARTSSVVWRTDVPEGSALDVVELPLVDDLKPVGAPPENAGGLRYVLPVLDLSTGTGRRRGLVRSIDASGRMVPPPASDTAVAEAGVAIPVVGGPFASMPAPESAASDGTQSDASLGRPVLMRSQQFTEAAPVLVVSPGGGEVVYAMRPAPEWETRSRLVPLFTGVSLPYLVRRIDGPPGLFVATAEELPSPKKEPASEVGVADEDGGASPLLLLGAAVAIAAGLTAAGARARRRRPAAGAVDGLSTPPGT